MLKALDSYHLFIKGIKVVPEVPSSETNAFGEKKHFWGVVLLLFFSRPIRSRIFQEFFKNYDFILSPSPENSLVQYNRLYAWTHKYTLYIIIYRYN